MFIIKKSRIPAWGYEITGKNYHNIAPSVEAAVKHLKSRYGNNVQYRVRGEKKS